MITSSEFVNAVKEHQQTYTYEDDYILESLHQYLNSKFVLDTYNKLEPIKETVSIPSNSYSAYINKYIYKLKSTCLVYDTDNSINKREMNIEMLKEDLTRGNRYKNDLSEDPYSGTIYVDMSSNIFVSQGIFEKDTSIDIYGHIAPVHYKYDQQEIINYIENNMNILYMLCVYGTVLIMQERLLVTDHSVVLNNNIYYKELIRLFGVRELRDTILDAF
jgi:hypothetical protein